MYLLLTVILLNIFCNRINGDVFENLTFDEILMTSRPGLDEEPSDITKLEKTDPLSSIQKLVPQASQMIFLLDKIKSPLCRRHAALVLQELHLRSSWALQMWDASAKSPDGFLAGVDHFLGNFDECINIDNYLESQNRIQGKYCLATINLKENEMVSKKRTRYINNEVYNLTKSSNTNTVYIVSQVHWAICVPSSCSNIDVQNFLESTLKKVNSKVPNTQFSVQLSKEKCYDKNKDNNFLDIYDISFIIVFFLICLLLVVATSYDHLLNWKKKINEQQGKCLNIGIISQVIISFSINENIKNIFKSDKNELDLDCLHGLKTISMFFILCGHCLLYFSSGPVTNVSFLNEAYHKIFYGFVYNNQLFVDSFLFIGGFLLSRMLLEEFNKGRSLNFFILYISRYIRLTPAYAFVVAFYSTVFIKMNNGPLWISRVGLEQERCKISWWTNLLYINNYVNTESLCMFQSWYVAVDTQMFILGSLIIYPLFWRPVLGKILLFGLTLISISIPFIITWIKRLDPVVLFYKSEIEDIATNEMFISTYIKTHMKMTPYLLGISLGYIIYKFQNSTKKISNIYLILGWILSTFLILISMFSISTFYNPDRYYDPTEAAFYASLDKVAWCLGLAWVIFACVTQNGGIVNRLLSWRAMIPFGRLTFGAYLVNGIVELHSVAILRSPRHLSVALIAKTIFVNTLLTFFGGLVLTLMLESPIIRLQKLLLRSMRKKYKRKNSDGIQC